MKNGEQALTRLFNVGREWANLVTSFPALFPLKLGREKPWERSCGKAFVPISKRGH